MSTGNATSRAVHAVTDRVLGTRFCSGCQAHRKREAFAVGARQCIPCAARTKRGRDAAAERARSIR
jgi:hypothetical protein